MDFFDRQDNARRSTRRLVVLFVAAVLLIVVAVNLAAAVIFGGVSRGSTIGEARGLFQPPLAIAVTVVTLAIIIASSLYKIASLRRGGETVARMLGGRPIDPNTTDLAERRVLNVVEEMAIASGTPVPPVFLLADEPGINAFASGHTADDAVIGVTAGTLEHLSRDQLQGVIAHEFSHILNGDMGLNLRLMGVLHGILVLALLGEILLRSMRYSTIGGRKREGQSIAAAIMLFGLALLGLGWIGVFFGRLIKAGVSRQREFLADAAGAQFTRNPQGLAGALKLIGGLAQGSQLKTVHAEQASHLFFGNGVKASLGGWLSTHPPLAERIRRLDPSWQGEFPTIDTTPTADAGEDALVSSLAAGQLAAASEAPETHPLAAASPATWSEQPQPPTSEVIARNLAASIGTLDEPHLAYSAELLRRLPGELRALAHEPSSARAIVYCLLLDSEPAVRRVQLDRLRNSTDPADYEEISSVRKLVDAVPEAARLPLTDLVLPALKRLSPRQYADLQSTARTLIEIDDRISLFELALQHLLFRHLQPHFDGARPPLVRYQRLESVQDDCRVLLSALAGEGHSHHRFAAPAFEAGCAHLHLRLALDEPRPTDFRPVDRALRRLRLLAPNLKRRLVEAAVITVAHDGHLTLGESELLRAITDALDCPMPPLLPVQGSSR